MTTSKPEIKERAVNEVKKRMFKQQIVTIMEDCSIPYSMIMNFDQAPLKFLPVASHYEKKARNM